MIAQMKKPSWRLRRRAVFGSLVFGAAIVTYVALRWESTSLAETLVLGGFGLMAAVVAAYTGTATWEDIGLRKTQNETFDDLHYGEADLDDVH